MLALPVRNLISSTVTPSKRGFSPRFRATRGQLRANTQNRARPLLECTCTDRAPTNRNWSHRLEELGTAILPLPRREVYSLLGSVNLFSLHTCLDASILGKFIDKLMENMMLSSTKTLSFTSCEHLLQAIW